MKLLNSKTDFEEVSLNFVYLNEKSKEINSYDCFNLDLYAFAHFGI